MAGVPGRSGRRRKPTALTIIEGGKANGVLARKRSNEPVPASTAKCPHPPKHMSDAARTYWKTHANALWEVGLLTKSDLTAWEQCCEAYAEVREAQEQKKKGLYVQDPTIPLKANGDPMVRKGIKNPYYQIEKEAFKRLTSMLDRFGMNPSSRARVSNGDRPPAEPPKEGSKWGGLLPTL